MPPSDSSSRPAWTGAAGSNSTPPITPSPLCASWKWSASRVAPSSQFQGSSEGESAAAVADSDRGKLKREKSRAACSASPCPTGKRLACEADVVGEAAGREFPSVWWNTSTKRSRSAPGQRSPTPSSNWTALSFPVTASSASRRTRGDSSST